VCRRARTFQRILSSCIATPPVIGFVLHGVLPLGYAHN